MAMPSAVFIALFSEPLAMPTQIAQPGDMEQIDALPQAETHRAILVEKLL